MACSSTDPQRAPSRHDRASNSGHRVDREDRRDERVRPCSQPDGEGRVDEHETCNGLGVGIHLQNGDEPAHRVAHENCRRSDDLGEETVEQSLVRLHGGRTPATPGPTETREIEGDDPAGLGQHGRYRGPVHH